MITKVGYWAETLVCYCNCSFAYAIDRGMMWAEIRKTFSAFVASLVQLRAGVQELRLLMRAVNSIALRFPIKQPRWRAGRWKSKT